MLTTRAGIRPVESEAQSAAARVVSAGAASANIAEMRNFVARQKSRAARGASNQCNNKAKWRNRIRLACMIYHRPWPGKPKMQVIIQHS